MKGQPFSRDIHSATIRAARYDIYRYPDTLFHIVLKFNIVIS